MARRILTKDSIDELLASGASEVRLEQGDIVTALAKEYALERGLRLVPAGSERQGEPRSAAPSPSPAEPSAALPEAVRKAVIGVLGYEPDGLDVAITKAMK